MSGKRRRNRDGGTFISDADDVVSAMIVKMNEAAEVSFPGSRDTLKSSTLLWGNGAINNIQKSGLYSARFHLYSTVHYGKLLMSRKPFKCYFAVLNENIYSVEILIFFIYNFLNSKKLKYVELLNFDQLRSTSLERDI